MTQSLYLNPRMLIILLLGFSSGLPLALVGGTLQARMTAEGVDLTLIGAASVITFPYTIKFLWAPFFDQCRLPFLGGGLRAWIIVTQFALILALALLGSLSPRTSLAAVFGAACLVSFLSASQDIAIDGFRTQMLRRDERGPGAGVTVLGYRLGMLLASSGALILSDLVSWQLVYLSMSGALLVGVVGTLFANEVVVGKGPRETTLRGIVIKPLQTYFKIPDAWLILIFIAVYKLGDVFAASLSTPFFLGLGFTRTDIGLVSKGAGLVATIAGGLVGGALVTKLGIRKSLLVCGVLQGLAIIAFWVLARVGHDYPTLVSAVIAENFGSGLGTAPLTAFLMALCNRGHAATQYALLSSIMSLSRVFLGSFTGKLAKSIGWELYFLVCIALCLPGILLAFLRGDRWAEFIDNKPEDGPLAELKS